jgi:hypothetical protein
MAEPQNYVGVVRGATNRFLGLYDQVKRVSPFLQFGLEKVEKMPWQKADPVIEVLDSGIDHLTSSVTSKVAAIQNRYQTSKAAVTASATKTTAKWKDLRGDLTKKAGLRIDQGLNQAREFSANRGKEIIHVDLIQYSREVIDGASDAVTRKLKPMYDPIARNLAVSMEKAVQAASQLRQSVATVADPAKLRLRLKQARRAARNLSSSGLAYAQAKYGDLASRIPDSSTLRHGLEFLASSPELFKDIKNKADLDASKSVLENLNSLVLAIRNVVCQQAPGQEIPAGDDSNVASMKDLSNQDEKMPVDILADGAPVEDNDVAEHAGDEEHEENDNQAGYDIPSQDDEDGEDEGDD